MKHPATNKVDHLFFLKKDASATERMYAVDWDLSPLGAPTGWPQSFRTALSMLSYAPSPMLLFWGPQALCFYNDSMFNILSAMYRQDIPIGMPGGYIWKERWPDMQLNIDAVLAGEHPPHFTLFTYSPVIGESGRPEGVLMMKNKDGENQKILSNLLALVEHNADFMGISSVNGESIYINKIGRQLLGLGEEQDLSGFTSASYFYDAADYERLMPEMLRALEEEGKWSGVITCFNFLTHEPIPFQADYILIRDPYTGEAIGRGATLHDLRPELAAREELLERTRKIAESEERFRILAGAMPQFVWTADVTGRITYFNQAFLDFTGLTLSGALGDNWLSIVHPDDQEENMRMWRIAVQAGNDYSFQQRFRSEDGRYRWQLSRGIPLRDVNGEIQQWIGTSTDIEEQKQMADELERMVTQRTAALSESNLNLERTNRELEQFAYVASHDLQEPLRKIRIFTEILSSSLTDERSASKLYLGKINASAARMSALIKDLLNFSQLQGEKEHFQPTDLNKVLNDVEGDFELLIHQQNAVIIAEDLPVLEVIPLQINQLFYNLLGNSLKFVSGKEKPLILITSRKVENVELVAWPTLDNSLQYHEIVISDNGIGFSQEYAQQIFTIFQRLNNREAYDGTGIGLAICKKIALNHRGEIWAVSEEGKGAAFHMLIPETQPVAKTY